MTETEMLPDAVTSILANQGKGREFISDHGFRNATRSGLTGVEIKVRLTSYRALPLSCIEEVKLSIDGTSVDPASITINVSQHEYRLSEFAKLSSVWWFILEHATIFVPWPGGLTSGSHLVEGTLVTVEPYVTAGRFSFHNSSSKQLVLEA